MKQEHTQGQSQIFTTIKYSQNNNTIDHSPHGSTNPKLLLKIDHPYIHCPKYPQLSMKRVREKSQNDHNRSGAKLHLSYTSGNPLSWRSLEHPPLHIKLKSTAQIKTHQSMQQLIKQRSPTLNHIETVKISELEPERVHPSNQ